MTTLNVEAVAREPRKDNKGAITWSVKAGGEWYAVHQVDQPKKGETIEGEVKSREWNGKTYRDLFPAKGSKAASNGHGAAVKFSDYERAMRMFHAIASELEHDDPLARSAIINTALIAYSNGKIELPPVDDEPPPPAPFDDEPPPWFK